MNETRGRANPFLAAIDRTDGPHTPRLALLFLVRSAMRLRGRLEQSTPRQVALEQAASTYPLPQLGSVERTKMLLAARSHGLVEGDPPSLTCAGDAILAAFDQETT